MVAEPLLDRYRGRASVTAVRRHATCVKRTTIMLPDALDARLRREAKRRGTSIAALAREAIEEQLPSPPADGPLSFFAIGDGSPADTSERVDEFVAAVAARRPRRSA